MDGSSIVPGMGADPSGGIDFRSLVDSSADLITVTGLDGVFRFVSAACYRLFGWVPSDLEGHVEDEFFYPDDLSSLHASRVAVANDEIVTWSYRFLCRDGSYLWIETTSRRARIGGSVMSISAGRDISERQALTTSLELRAFTDPLTGVANRPVLTDRLHQALRRMRQSDSALAVLYLDLDRFKVLNDSLGHGTGDAVLLQMAERLMRRLGPADTLGRLGGDEFVIVAAGLADEKSAIEFAQRIIEAAREPFQVDDDDLICTVSAGIAYTTDSERRADDLLGEANLALYRAKLRGRDRVEVFAEDMRTTAVDRLATERVLRRAVNHGQLVVQYQPIIDLRTGRPVGAEALMRLRDPEWGLLLPQSFLEVAEETGLLTRMDEQVLADAVKVAGAWHTRAKDADLAEVAINVPAHRLTEAGFPKTVIDQLDAYEVPHSNLQIEVTERSLLEASDSTMTGIRALRDAGIRVGLDDFGTGYSSLAYLGRFPLDFVKIDKSFVDDLEGDNNQQAIVATIIGLLHALGLTVVAEGVESEGQLRILKALECDRAQGFLFAGSGPPGAIDKLVTGDPRPTPQE